MKRIFSSLMSALLFTAVMLSAGSWPAKAAVDYSQVKVKLSVGTVTSVGVGVNGSYFILENSAVLPGSGVVVSVVPGQAAVSVADTMGNLLYSGPKATIIRSDMQSGGSGVLRMVNAEHGTRNYLGHMTFSYNNGAVMVINTVPMQQYLYGVVGHEMNNTWPIEALKAQAVAARGYAARMMTGAAYDLVDTASDQVYKGYNPENTNVIKAVEDTAWEVLSYNGQLVVTYYAASNGGQTDLSQNAWNEAYPYFAIVDDPYDLQNPESLHQDVIFPKNTQMTPLNSLLDGYLKNKIGPILQQQGYSAFSNQIRILGIQSLEGHTPKHASPSKNWTQARITVLVGAQQGTMSTDPFFGQMIMSTGAETQIPVQFDFPLSELKDANLPYQLFTNGSLRMFRIYDAGDSFVLSNVRYGHGVGMSQRGAQQMANSGMNYRNILSFYYVNTQITKLSGSIIAAPTAAPQAIGSSGASVGVVSASTLNLRSEPNTKAKVLAKLKRNDQLTITADTGTWYAVNYNGVSGYVSKDYVRVVQQASSGQNLLQQPVTTPAQATGPIYGTVTGDGVNVRNGPGTEYDRVAVANKGQSVQVLSAFGDWFQININGTTAYISATYLAVNDLGQIPGYGSSLDASGAAIASTPAAAPAPTLDPSKIFGQVTADSTAVLKKPTSAASKLKDVQKGYVIEIAAQNDNYYQVLEEGKKYWVIKTALTVLAQGAAHPNPSQVSQAHVSSATIGSTGSSSTVSARKGKVANLNEYTYIYEKPDTSTTRIAKAMKGAEFEIVSEEGEFYLVTGSASKLIGYLRKKYVAIISSDSEAEPKATAKPKSEPEATSKPKASSTPKPTEKPKTSAKKGDTVSVSRESARVYDAVGAPGYSTLSEGSKMTILGSSGDYYKVEYKGGQVGYVKKGYVK